jgi:hypothetical protein
MLLKSTSAERECKENTEYENKGEKKKIGIVLKPSRLHD